MPSDIVLGIDTSNYTTSVSLATVEGDILCNLKSPLPVKEGECGLRQSDAVFAHVKNLPLLMREAEERIAENKLVAVGVSTRPRNVEGSYMPCFLVGECTAQAISSAAKIPLFRFSHQCGHIRAALYSAGKSELKNVPFGAFHVSGGTTEMLSVSPAENGFSVEVVGGSKDLHAGQAVDRIGVMLGLKFPCGPALEKLAMKNEEKFAPRGTHTDDGYIHLSGLQNLAVNMKKKGASDAAVAAFTLDYLGRAMIAMSSYYREHIANVPLLYAGGVMSNKLIREAVCRQVGDAYFAEPVYSADNAAGIALLTAEALLKDG